MKILKRHKDSHGITIGYTVEDNNFQRYLNSNTVISMFGSITNADLLPNGEFRAKQGEHIETVIDNTNLLVSPQKNIIANKQSSLDNIDYYGKSHINICRKIRKYACEGRLIIDTNRHKSNDGRNLHLFKLIEACNLDVKTFIQGYLSVLQPYSLKKFQESRKLTANNIWICDIGYKTSLIIKVDDTNSHKPLVVSFHESNLKGSFSIGQKDFSDKLCAVLIDKVKELHNGFGVDYNVQRGFIRYNIHSSTKYYKNGVALINYADIKIMYDDTMNLVFEQIRDNYLDIDSESPIPVIVRRKDTSGLSFMSFGYAIPNNLCYLLDLYSQYTDTKSRAVLTDMAVNVILEVPDTKYPLLRQSLSDRYLGSKNKLYLAIDNLLSNTN